MSRHHYLNLGKSKTYPGKLVVGTTEYSQTPGNGLNIKHAKIVEIPSSFNEVEVAEIGAFSFKDTGIISVFIPKTVLCICNEAFNSCKNLTNVQFEDGSKLEKVGAWAFHCCTSLRNIDFPASITNIVTNSQWNFFAAVPLQCFSYGGTHDFSSLTNFFYTVSNVYVSDSYPSDKFAGVDVSKGSMTCGVNKEHLEIPNYGISWKHFKCSVVLKRFYIPFQQFIFLVHS
jgi:hypothetical protein